MFSIGQKVICIRECFDETGAVIAKRDSIYQIVDIKTCKCKDHCFIHIGAIFPSGRVDGFCMYCRHPVNQMDERIFITSKNFAPIQHSDFGEKILEKIEKEILKEYEMFETLV